MFCPNCGTKNPSNEQKCSQCGFSLLKEAQKPNFKGTMVMQGTGSPASPGGASPVPATPTTSDPTPEATETDDTSSAALRGTMLGVAPPDMQAALKAARDAIHAKTTTPRAAGGNPPADRAPRATPAQLGATQLGFSQPTGPQTVRGTPMERTPGAGSLGLGRPNAAVPARPSQAGAAAPAPRHGAGKGTMMGVAPPDLQRVLNPQSPPTPSQQSSDVRPPAAMSRPSPPPRTGPAAPHQNVQARPPAKGPAGRPGTMLGVAPPDVSEAVAAAQQTTGAARQASAHTTALSAEGRPVPASGKIDAYEGTVLGGPASAAADNQSRGDASPRHQDRAPHPRLAEESTPPQRPHAPARTALAATLATPAQGAQLRPAAGATQQDADGRQPAPSRAGPLNSAQGLGERADLGGTIASASSFAPLEAPTRRVRPETPASVAEEPEPRTTAFSHTISSRPPQIPASSSAPRVRSAQELLSEDTPPSGSPLLLLAVAVVAVLAVLVGVLFLGGNDESSPTEGDALEESAPSSAEVPADADVEEQK